MASKKHIFNELEKKTFVDILKRHSRVIENKNTDASTLRAKNYAWECITREYNANPHVTAEFTSKQLRRLWMNLKQRQRGALSRERQHRMATRGGPSTRTVFIDPDAAEEAPDLIIGKEEAIDSDTLPESSEVSIQLVNLCPVPTPSPPIHPVPTPSPPLRPVLTPSPPPQSTQSTPATCQRHKNAVLDRDFMARQRRADELHELEKELLQYRIREAKAKALLAERELRRDYLKDQI